MTNEEFIKSISLEGEEWRDVVGYEGVYMVSSMGRVISLSKHVGKYYVSQPRLRKQPIGKHGYPVVMLTNNYKKKLRTVHRLVAEAFLPNPDNKSDVDHIDTNRVNCRLDNLRWCTRRENNLNPLTNSRNKEKGRLKRMPTKWTPVVSISPDGDIKRYNCMADAKTDGHLPSQISRCSRGVIKQHHGYRWMYLSDYETLVSMSKNSADPSAD